MKLIYVFFFLCVCACAHTFFVMHVRVYVRVQCRLVSLCEDNSLHLWQMTPQEDACGMQLTKVNSTSLEGK